MNNNNYEKVQVEQRYGNVEMMMTNNENEQML